MIPGNALEHRIRQVEHRRRLVVDMELTDRGRIRWTATLSGDSFLDGPWEQTKTGTASDRGEAMAQVRKEFE